MAADWSHTHSDTNQARETETDRQTDRHTHTRTHAHIHTHTQIHTHTLHLWFLYSWLQQEISQVHISTGIETQIILSTRSYSTFVNVLLYCKCSLHLHRRTKWWWNPERGRLTTTHTKIPLPVLSKQQYKWLSWEKVGKSRRVVDRWQHLCNTGAASRTVSSPQKQVPCH